MSWMRALARAHFEALNFFKDSSILVTAPTEKHGGHGDYAPRPPCFLVFAVSHFYGARAPLKMEFLL